MNLSGLNLRKRLKKIIAEWKVRKLIRDYCISESGRKPAPKYLNCLLVFLAFSVFFFWKASSYGEVLRNLLLLMAVLFVTAYVFNKKEYGQLVEECRNKLAEREYGKRLDKTRSDEVLRILKDKITADYPAVRDAKLTTDMLIGVYADEKLAVVYRYVGEEDVVGTRDLLYLLHDCRQQGIKEVRVFTNGEFGQKADRIGERYDINLKLYNGSVLKMFLKGSSLYPTESEIDSVLKRESEKRQRKIGVLRTEILQRNKFKNYFFYSLVLFIMARYGMGAVYWNIFFGVLLLVLAAFSLLPNRDKKEEEIVF